jgi:hypothetical protein
MKQEVMDAIQELESAYGKDNVAATPDQQGGAYVIVQNLDLGPVYAPSTTWCGFAINHMYPDAQVYPHYFPSEVKRADGSAFGGGFSHPADPWQGHSVVQISRTSKSWNPAQDTAEIKLEKVLNWMRSL